MKIGELIYNLVFESDTTKLNDFIKAVGTLDMSSIMGALGVGQLYEVTKKLLNSATATAMGLKTFESVTGLSALKMKSWSDVAEQAGVNAGAFESSIILRLPPCFLPLLRF